MQKQLQGIWLVKAKLQTEYSSASEREHLYIALGD